MNNKLAKEVSQFYKELIKRYGIEEFAENSESFPLILLDWKYNTDDKTISVVRNHFKGGPTVIIYISESNKYKLQVGKFSNIKYLNGLELPCSCFSTAKKYVDKLLLKANCILV